jgi:hypothetical protein
LQLPGQLSGVLKINVETSNRPIALVTTAPNDSGFAGNVEVLFKQASFFLLIEFRNNLNLTTAVVIAHVVALGTGEQNNARGFKSADAALDNPLKVQTLFIVFASNRDCLNR